jgi:hypothetical protein
MNSFPGAASVVILSAAKDLSAAPIVPDVCAERSVDFMFNHRVSMWLLRCTVHTHQRYYGKQAEKG